MTINQSQTTAQTPDFGWTAACEREAVRQAKRITELLAELMRLDSQLGAPGFSFRDRLRAAEGLVRLKGEAESVLGEIACAR